MHDQFMVRIGARGYEVDVNGHVAGAVLLQYGQHARWECLGAAGIDQAVLIQRGMTPVSLEEWIRFHKELHTGDVVDVSCRFTWGEAKSFRIEQEIRKADGTLVAEIATAGGFLDLKSRHLIDEPSQAFRSLANTPGLLGL
jgi:acyl-CoA thioester hydrolase